MKIHAYQTVTFSVLGFLSCLQMASTYANSNPSSVDFVNNKVSVLTSAIGAVNTKVESNSSRITELESAELVIGSFVNGGVVFQRNSGKKTGTVVNFQQITGYISGTNYIPMYANGIGNSGAGYAQTYALVAATDGGQRDNNIFTNAVRGGAVNEEGQTDNCNIGSYTNGTVINGACYGGVYVGSVGEYQILCDPDVLGAVNDTMTSRGEATIDADAWYMTSNFTYQPNDGSMFAIQLSTCSLQQVSAGSTETYSALLFRGV